MTPKSYWSATNVRTEIKTKFGELEYRQLIRIAHGRRNPNSEWAQVASRQVRLRNRYINIQPWDKSRVHLKVSEGESDYINASPISLLDPRRGTETTYVAAQGPKESGSSPFWHMIWQQTTDVAVIVMLTQTAEGGREKCFQYFPLDLDAEAISIDPLDTATSSLSGKVQLQEITNDERTRTTIRKLLLTVGAESRTVWHLLFSGWPDFEIPKGEDRAALLELLKLSATKSGNASNPRIIHCSAGVGRSGSFIALEYLLAQIEIGAVAEAVDSEDMVFEVVDRLREQRMTMVQSEAQYLFLYEVLREQFQQSRKLAQASGIRQLASGIKAVLTGQVSENGGETGCEADVIAEKGKAPTES